MLPGSQKLSHASNGLAGLPSAAGGELHNSKQRDFKRAEAMATVMAEKRGANGHCTFDDLLEAGFSAQEVGGLEPQAIHLAREKMLRQVGSFLGDTFYQVKDLCLQANITRMPVMGGVVVRREHDFLWSTHCAARAAWRLDPWAGQRQRALRRLDAFLKKQPLLDGERADIVNHVGRQMEMAERFDTPVQGVC